MKEDLYVCLCYVVPDNSSRQSVIEVNTFDRLQFFITDLSVKHGDELNLILCGDFNARSSDCADYVTDDNILHMYMLPDDYVVDHELKRYSQDKGCVNSNGRDLLSLCQQCQLRILNGRVGTDKHIGKYTFIGHQGCSLVDYVICTQNLIQNVNKFEVSDPLILTDHCLVSFSLDFDKPTENQQTNDCTYDSIDAKFVWCSEGSIAFGENIASPETTVELDNLATCISCCTEGAGLNECIKKLSNIIEGVASPMLRNCHKNDSIGADVTSNQPWFTNDCYDKRSTFLYMLNKFRENKSDENRTNMTNARSEYKKTLNRSKFEFDTVQTQKLTKARVHNAKLYWRMLKQGACIQKSNIELNSFERYFKSVNNPDSQFFTPDEDILHFIDRYENDEFGIMFEELNLEFSEADILKAINELKLNRSAGPDMLINEFFIHGKGALVKLLCTLFNKLFEIGHFPEAWSEGHVIPLHKKGSINNVENYRGITLLSTLGKLFTRVLNNRLTLWAESYGVYVEAQAGFRSNMSTVDNIFVLHGLISSFINSGKTLYCAFIDFTKAFDYVVRDNLWFKLIKLGLRGKILNIIRSMYNVVKARVKYYNKLSDNYDCVLGVRQGECLSPFLFSMFLNDLEDTLITKGGDGLDVDDITLFLMLYADDIVVFGKTKEELQNNLDLLADYCNRWKLVVNVSKTKIMIFRKGGAVARNLEFSYNGNKIDIVNKFSYLGMVFTTGGSFACALATLSGQALKAIFKMNKYLYKFTNISVKHRLELFDKLVAPVLNYGSEVWGFQNADTIERVHMKFCKTILGVKKSTQNDFIYGELGRKSMLCNRQLVIYKYWFKILESKDSKYVKKVYNMLLKDSDDYPNKKNWVTLLRDTLGNLGFHEVWLAQGVGQKSVFIALLKQRIHDNFIQTWEGRLNNSSRALFYNAFRSFELQPYLKTCNLMKFRQSLTRLRVSSHRLEVESGRWNKPNPKPLLERKCKLCDTLEDEYHFVIVCPMYNDIRHLYIKQFYTKRPSMYKFISLINCTSEKQIRNLAVFVHKAFEIRNTNVFVGAP